MKHHLSLLFVAILFASSCSGKSGQSAAEADTTDTIPAVSHLRVEGTHLVDTTGTPVVLTGPSLGWHSIWGRFYNAGTVRALKEKWGANITRAAIGAHSSGDVSGCFDQQPDTAIALTQRVIDAAIANGMYVIADWHSHQNTLSDAKKFFTAITEKYGDCPNILYEIWNEPLEIPWQEIKDYAAELIPLIRAKAPNAVIIVGTPKWDQDVDVAAQSPIDEPNLLYSLHFYAATHKDYLRDKARQAIDAGLPLIISECGSMEHTGDGPIDHESFEEWVKLADENGLSMLFWDIADKNETCSMIDPSAPSDGMQWTENQLRPWAKLARQTTRRRNS